MEEKMDKPSPRYSPTADTRVVRIAQERFSSTEDARAALRKAIDEISDDQLLFVRGIRILVMA
jgi:hypothetical protein